MGIPLKVAEKAKQEKTKKKPSCFKF